jgi:hypothetical protein
MHSGAFSGRFSAQEAYAMPAWSLLTVLTVAWATVTLILAVLVAYRSLVGFKEEDTLVLSFGESNLQEEQKQVQARLHHLRPFILGFGWASAALLAIIAGIWIYRGIENLLA